MEVTKTKPMNIKTIFKALFQNLGQKVANPFLGTFIVVWLIRHWDAIYTVLTINSKLSYDLRISKIMGLFDKPFLLDLAITLGVTFAVLIVTYLLTDLGKFIAKFNTDRVLSKLMECVGESNVVLIEKHNETVKELENWKTRFDDEHDDRLRKETEIERLERRLKELLANQSLNTTKPSPASLGNLDDTSQEMSDNDFQKILTRLENRHMVSRVLDVLKEAKVGADIAEKDRAVLDAGSLNLIEHQTKRGGGWSTYTLTETGRKFLAKMMSGESKDAN